MTNATLAYEQCIRYGGQTALPPTRMVSADNPDGPGVIIAEVRAYGDVVLRFLSREPGYTDDLLLPTYKSTPPPKKPLDYGIERVDHAVGNVWDLLESVNYISRMTGFHEVGSRMWWLSFLGESAVEPPLPCSELKSTVLMYSFCHATVRRVHS